MVRNSISKNEPESSNDISKLKKQLLDAINPLSAIQAVYELAKIGSDTALESLLSGFSNPDTDVKLAILDTLSQAEFFNEKVVDSVLKLLDDNDLEIKTHAVEILGMYKSKNAVPILIKLLNNKNKELRLCIIDALASIGDTRAVDAIQPFAKSKKWEERYHAVDALGMLGDPRSVDVLCEALNDPNPKVREITALSVTIYNSPKIIGFLLDLLHDSKPQVQAAAAYTLGEMKNLEAVPLLVEFLTSDIVDLVVIACEALGKIHDIHCLHDLIALLDHPASEVQSAAAQALDFFDSSEIIEPFIQLILNDNKTQYLKNRLKKMPDDKFKQIKISSWLDNFLQELRKDLPNPKNKFKSKEPPDKTNDKDSDLYS